MTIDPNALTTCGPTIIFTVISCIGLYLFSFIGKYLRSTSYKDNRFVNIFITRLWRRRASNILNVIEMGILGILWNTRNGISYSYFENVRLMYNFGLCFVLYIISTVFFFGRMAIIKTVKRLNLRKPKYDLDDVFYDIDPKCRERYLFMILRNSCFVSLLWPVRSWEMRIFIISSATILWVIHFLIT